MTTQPTLHQVMVVQQTPSGGLVCERAGSSPRQRPPIRARLISDTTAAALGVTISASDPITALAKRLVRDGYDPELPMVIWKADKPWCRLERIGHPNQV